jgi:hypothetical protein
MSSILDGLFARCRKNIIDFVKDAVADDKKLRNVQENFPSYWMNVTKSGEGTSHLCKLSIKVDKFLAFDTLRTFFLRDVYVKDSGIQCLFESQNADIIDEIHPHQFLAAMNPGKYTRCCIFYKRVDVVSGETHIVIDVGKTENLMLTEEDYALSWKMLEASSNVRSMAADKNLGHVVNSDELLNFLQATQTGKTAMCIRCNKLIM